MTIKLCWCKLFSMCINNHDNRVKFMARDPVEHFILQLLFFANCPNQIFLGKNLQFQNIYVFKGILWDRRWIAPSIGIFSHTCGFVYRNAFLLLKLSDPSPNCFTIEVWNINCWRQQFISYLSYCFFVSHFMAFYTSSVVFWDVIFWK